MLIAEIEKPATLRPAVPCMYSLAVGPQWSSDGTKVAYLARRGNRDCLIVTDGEKVIADSTPPGSGYVTSVTWNSTSDTIAVLTTGKADAVQLFRVLTGSWEYREVPGYSLQEVAWAPAKDMLITARSSQSDFYRLFRYSPDITTLRLLATEVGDISDPFWTHADEHYAYHIKDYRQQVAVVTTPDGLVKFGGNDVVTTVLNGGCVDSNLVLRSCSSSELPRFQCIPLTQRTISPMLSPLREFAACGPLQDVWLEAADGMRTYSALLMAADSTVSATRALIYVHGGPTLVHYPTFHPGIWALRRCGVHVIIPNYRGSQGFGKTYEDEADVTGQVLDIVACKTFVEKELRVPSSKIVIVGESYGAQLAVMAAGQGPNRDASCILVSAAMPHTPSATLQAGTPPKVRAFFGRNDESNPREIARTLEALVGVEQLQFVETTILEREGHHFIHPESIAAVYGVAAEVLGVEFGRERNI